tara:strand:- start:291 stop:707 length:417 start_codon:yes stop_codon:yes gene_type:complete
MPAPTYVDGATGLHKGVKEPESGIKVESVDWTFTDPKEYSFDEHGGHDGFAHGFNPSVEISISGEVKSTSEGLPISQYGTAITIANKDNVKIADQDSTATFANIPDTGGFYPESISFSESRDGFRSMTISAIMHPSIT